MPQIFGLLNKDGVLCSKTYLFKAESWLNAKFLNVNNT